MLSCSTCKEIKKDECFNWKKKNVRRATVCKDCHKIYRRKHYLANQEKYIAKARKWDRQNGKSISRSKIYALEYLMVNPCVQCGESNPCLLEFDHLNREEKIASISVMINQYRSFDLVKKEIGKCQILCNRCHRLKTSNEFNWYKWYNDLDSKYKNLYP